MPPPGPGVNTMISKVPAVSRSVAGRIAVNCAALTKVVPRDELSNCTTDEETNPDPFTVRVSAVSPTKALAGTMFDVEGRGLFTVNGSALDSPPPGRGLNTVMLNVPAVSRSDASIEASTRSLLTRRVTLSDPLNRTTEPAMNPVPFTVMVNASSRTVLLVGDRLVMVGTGFCAIADAVDNNMRNSRLLPDQTLRFMIFISTKSNLSNHTYCLSPVKKQYLKRGRHLLVSKGKTYCRVFCLKRGDNETRL